MNNLTKEKYRKYLSDEIEHIDTWRKQCPFMKEESKIELMKLKAMCMENLYRLDTQCKKEN